MTIFDDLPVGVASSKPAIYVGIHLYTLHLTIILQLLKVGNHSIVLCFICLETLSILDQVFPKLIHVLTVSKGDSRCAFWQQNIFSQPNPPSPIQPTQPNLSSATRMPTALRFSPYAQRLQASPPRPLGRIISPQTASSISHQLSPARFRAPTGRRRFRPRHYDSSQESSLHCVQCGLDKPIEQFSHTKEIGPKCFQCQQPEQVF